MTSIDSVYEAKLLDAGLRLSEPYKGTTSLHHLLECVLCGNRFEASLKAKVQNYKKSGLRGCPKCTKSQRYSSIREDMKRRMTEMGYEVFGDFENNRDLITVRNSKCSCGRRWQTRPIHILSGRAFCRPCNDDTKRERLDASNKERHYMAIKNLDGFKRYTFIVRTLTERTYRENKQKINPNNLPRTRVGGDGFQLDHIVSIKQCYENGVPPEICASVENLRMIPRADNAAKYSKPITQIPTVLRNYIPIGDKIDSFINDMKLTFIDSRLETFVPLGHDAIHILHPDSSTGVFLVTFNEYKEQSIKAKRELIRLRELARSNGINLILIYENEWNEKRNIVIHRISHKFKMKSEVVYARKLVISEIDKKTKSEFLKLNHLQGDAASTINLGAFWGDRLVSVMTFSKPRIAMGRRKKVEDQYELVRFASDLRLNVVGAASKLLEHFKRNYDWSEIYSYADLRWGDGEMYEKIGFSSVGSTPPNYWYIIDGDLKHRFAYRKDVVLKRFKDRIQDKYKTEYQLMLELGYDRIWDCGSKKFIMNK